jgi:hypothetical protein
MKRTALLWRSRRSWKPTAWKPTGCPATPWQMFQAIGLEDAGAITQIEDPTA